MAQKPVLRERKKIPVATRELLLTESGYRCGVPRCREILAIDMHHILEVSEGGSDEPTNLIPLCPGCHAHYHRGTISSDAIYTCKALLVSISRGFDVDAVDKLMFLEMMPTDFVVVSGDGLLQFGRLIAAGLATAELKAHNNWQIVNYAVNISEKGRLIIQAWKDGDRTRLRKLIAGPVPDGGLTEA